MTDQPDLLVPDYSGAQSSPLGSDEQPHASTSGPSAKVELKNKGVIAGAAVIFVAAAVLFLAIHDGSPQLVTIPPVVPARCSGPDVAVPSWALGWSTAASEATCTGDGKPISELAPSTRGEACAGRGGAVASTNFQATKAGLAVLANGGNAADAAVAVQLALGVAQPESNGLGGGCFIVVYNASTREVVTIDGREEAPAAFHPNVYCADLACGLDPDCEACPSKPIGFRDRYTGGLAVGVPGTLAAAARLLSDHGTRPMADVAAPAIELARGGITMTHHLHSAIAGSTNVRKAPSWPRRWAN
jgi:gamma-glutamyltranspeptidase/glutathione hydrolase